MSKNEKSCRLVPVLNPIGYATYYCGACGGIVFDILHEEDIEHTIPKECPICHRPVKRSKYALT